MILLIAAGNRDISSKHGLKKENIPFYIDEKDCLFHQTKSQLIVECEWVAPIGIKSLNWDGGFFRKDIGYKVIDE